MILEYDTNAYKPTNNGAEGYQGASGGKHYKTENTSYSAMLNIVESVPPTEPIPSNSRNSVYHFQYNSGIPGISSYQFLGIPGIPSDSGIE
jgi:hypothetical protein